jgi:hypothetical protein
VPVAYRNYEIYIGYEGEYGNGEREKSLPFAGINYGPLPNLQVAGSFSLPKSDTDDFGIKYRFIPARAAKTTGRAASRARMNDDYSRIHSLLFSLGTSIAGARTFDAYLAYELRLGPKPSASPLSGP